MAVELLRKAPLFLLLVAFFASGRGLAQTVNTTSTDTSTSTGFTGATSLSTSDFTFYTEYYDPHQNNGTWVQMNTTQQQYFFNRARCECWGDGGDGSNYTGYFQIVIQPGAGTAQKIQQLLATNAVPFGHGRLYAGNNGVNCLSPGSYSCSLASNCTNLLDPNDPNAEFPLTVFESQRQYVSPPIPVSRLFGSVAIPTCGCSQNCDTGNNCDIPLTSQAIYFWAQTNSGTSPDLTSLSFTVNLNGALQYGPSDVTVKGGNDALIVSWDWATGLTPSADPNFLGLQLFCQRGASDQVFPKGSYGASYMQSSAVCPAAAPIVASPSAFSNLDPIFLCSGLLPSTSTGYRISGLQNGIYYGVGVAAVDRYGNASPIDPSSGVHYGMPVATVDFYTNYRDDGGKAQGGFCALAGWRKQPSAVVLASGLALALILARRRRKKGPPGSAALVLLVAAGTLAARPARAQAIYHDEPDEEETTEEPAQEPAPETAEKPAAAPASPPVWAGTERDFALEMRFGLYMPNVDSEFGDSKTAPNAFIFGTTRRPMWQVEFDWEFLQTFGTLAVGASVGYWKENGQACLLSDLQLSGTCTRSGDATSLRLIPFAALLVYRMDEAATRWKIPLVPYGKIGLNYTIWTINNGDGNVPDYRGGGHGQGGTAGWQAAIGLALQLDFIDPAAAHEFDADAGVNHTYAFFELDHVDGSGLYRKDVLRVGDDTWFAGLMFEF